MQAPPLVLRRMCLRVRILSLSLDSHGLTNGSSYPKGHPARLCSSTALNKEAIHTLCAPGCSFVCALLEATTSHDVG